jgi:hypothetical protein
MRTCALFRLGVLGVAPVVFNWDTRPRAVAAANSFQVFSRLRPKRESMPVLCHDPEMADWGDAPALVAHQAKLVITRPRLSAAT